MNRQGTIIASVCITAAAVTAAGCSSTASSGAAAQRSQASGVLHSATANPSVEAAIAKAKRDVVNPCIDGSSGPVSFKNCVYAKIPKSQRHAVEKCVGKALLADHIKTEAGKAKWLDTDVPACVGAAMP